MSRCCVKNCKSNRKDGVTLFKMPEEPQKIKDEWISFFLTCEMDENYLKTQIFVCEKHFEEEFLIQKSNRLILKKNSVPSIPAISMDHMDFSTYDDDLFDNSSNDTKKVFWSYFLSFHT